MDGPEVHVPHKAHTGHRWLDITLGVTALMVSAISLYVAVHHGQTMEKLVEANSFPNVELNFDLNDGSRPDQISLEVRAENNGVGPARVETLEIWDGAKPLTSVHDIIAAIKTRGDGSKFHATLAGSTVLDSLLGAGKSRSVLELQMDRQAWLAAAARFSGAARDRVCYCSVFEECFVADSSRNKGRPAKVKVCPTPAHPFADDLNDVLGAAVVRAGPKPAPEPQAAPPEAAPPHAVLP